MYLNKKNYRTQQKTIKDYFAAVYLLIKKIYKKSMCPPPFLLWVNFRAQSAQSTELYRSELYICTIKNTSKSIIARGHFLINYIGEKVNRCEPD